DLAPCLGTTDGAAVVEPVMVRCGDLPLSVPLVRPAFCFTEADLTQARIRRNRGIEDCAEDPGGFGASGQVGCCDADRSQWVAAAVEFLGDQVCVAKAERCQVRVVPAADEVGFGVVGVRVADYVKVLHVPSLRSGVSA